MDRTCTRELLQIIYFKRKEEEKEKFKTTFPDMYIYMERGEKRYMQVAEIICWFACPRSIYTSNKTPAVTHILYEDTLLDMHQT